MGGIIEWFYYYDYDYYTILYYTTTHMHNLSRFSDVMCNGVRRAASATINQ